MNTCELASRESEHVEYFFEIDITTLISPVLHVNFDKIHRNSKVFISITLLFGRMLSLVKGFTKCREPQNFSTPSMGN